MRVRRRNPRIRAITGFITIDANSYPAQIEEAVTFLSQIREAEKAAGYEVSGIRISTQPFPEYTRGMSRVEALRLLRGINELAGKLKFAPNIGPAMLKDDDDAGSVDLLIEVLSTSGNRLAANIVTAGEDGIHWNAVRQAARIIHAVGEHSPHGQGNFQLCRDCHAEAVWTFLSGRVASGWWPAQFCDWTRIGQCGDGRVRA